MCHQSCSRSMSEGQEGKCICHLSALSCTLSHYSDQTAKLWLLWEWFRLVSCTKLFFYHHQQSMKGINRCQKMISWVGFFARCHGAGYFCLCLCVAMFHEVNYFCLSVSVPHRHNYNYIVCLLVSFCHFNDWVSLSSPHTFSLEHLPRVWTYNLLMEVLCELTGQWDPVLC